MPTDNDQPDPEGTAEESAEDSAAETAAAFGALAGARAADLPEPDADAAAVEAATSVAPDQVEWSRPWMATFLDTLRRIPNVTAAAKTAGIVRQTAQYARKRDPLFDAAWTAALEESVDNLEQFAHSMSSTGLEQTETRTTTKRALVNGAMAVVEETTVVTTSRLLSPQMAMFMLTAHRPEKYRRAQRFEHTGAEGQPIQVTQEERDAAVGAFTATVVRLADRRAADEGAAGGGAG